MYSPLRISILFFLFLPGTVLAQQRISIETCYAKARDNYPLLKQADLLARSEAYSLANASKGYWPQATVNGQATYQSAVTELPISVPNVTVPALSKDQYKLYGEVVQPLTDVITVHRQKELLSANAAVESQKLEVELYKLKERINNIYFSILLLDAQVAQAALLKNDLDLGLKKTNAAIANGTGLHISAELLQAELIKADQRIIELKTARKGFLHMLAVFTAQDLDSNTRLEQPLMQKSTVSINRPELKLYEQQEATFKVQDQLITARNIPRFHVFFQGGFGRPALNFLSNDFEPYYITGLRLNWSFSGLYTARKERKLLDLNRSTVALQREIFLFNTQLSLTQQSTELEKYEALIQSDKQIIELREKVKTTANAQLEQDALTTNDYLNYVNAADQARQNLALHETQYLMAQYNYQTISGN